MAAQRVSRLQRRILGLLLADHRRIRGGMSMGHFELVKALEGDKSNISHSLRTLETRGWIAIGRTTEGRADFRYLTAEGLEKASQICGKL